MMQFTLFMLFLVLLRIGELIYAKHNEKWLLQNGAVEYGQKHYPLIVALHTLFFVSLIVEYLVRETAPFNGLLLLLYLLLLALKVWVLATLGKFWNTKIYRIQHFPTVKKGPYRYIKHPNYLIVIGEIALIPLVFHLYFTAILFSVLNGFVLYIRIKEENRALAL